MRIEHLAVWVKDIEKMKLFYESYFSATSNELYFNPKKKFSSYFLSFPDGPRFELMHRPDIAERLFDFEQESLGLAHIAISLGSKEKVDELTNQLRTNGFKVIGEPRTTGDGYYESVILDPENNRVELTV